MTNENWNSRKFAIKDDYRSDEEKRNAGEKKRAGNQNIENRIVGD
jgi:hypothetical protein